MTTRCYYFTGASQNCRTYVRFNGAPLLEAEPDQAVSTSENVSVWALAGTSRLEVSLSKVPNAAPEDVSFKARLLEAPAGVSPAGSLPIWQFSWPPTNIGDVVPFYRVFDIPTETQSELWARAEILTLDDETRDSAILYTQHLHALFASGDPDALADEMLFRGEDLGLVEGTTKSESELDQRRFFRLIMQPNEFTFQARPINIGKSDLRIVGDHKVLRVRSGGIPALLSTEGQGLEVYLSRENGRWFASR